MKSKFNLFQSSPKSHNKSQIEKIADKRTADILKQSIHSVSLLSIYTFENVDM